METSQIIYQVYICDRTDAYQVPEVHVYITDIYIYFEVYYEVCIYAVN